MLKLAHVVGAVLIGGGLIGVWLSDIRSRQIRDLPQFSEAVRNIAVFYDGIVVPGAIVLLVSGTWLIVQFYGGWSFLSVPWLAGMVFLFAFEFIEGNATTIQPLTVQHRRRVASLASCADDRGVSPRRS